MMQSYNSLTNLNIDLDNNNWGFDSVTNKELGWHLATKLYDQRKSYVIDIVEYLNKPKISNRKKAINLLSNLDDYNLVIKLYVTLSKELRDDFSILEMLAKDNKGYCICEASARLQNDVETVKMIMKYDTNNIIYLSEEMKNNLNVIRVVAKQGSEMIKDAGPNCLDNISIAYSSVINNPYTLKFFSDNIKDNEIIVITAIEQDRKVLIYSSKRFRESLKMQYLPIWVLKKIKIP